MRNKIQLITATDVTLFNKICSQINEDVILTDNTGKYIVNAKSILGCLYSLEWNEDIYVECKKDIYSLIKDYIV